MATPEFTKIYNTFIRANLPFGITFAGNHYRFNGKSFTSYSAAYWYYRYLRANGFNSDPYAVLTFAPKYVLDFVGNYYRVNGIDSTLKNAVTHTRLSNATMTDSDGLLKWGPHNNLSKSNTFSTWNKVRSTVVANNAVGPNGTANAASTVSFTSTTSDLYNLSTVAVTQGDKITLAVWVRSDTLTSVTLSINGRASSSNNSPFANRAVTSTWSLVTFEVTVQANDTGLFFIFGYTGSNLQNTVVGDLEIYGAHMYRSDLGGMVNNSETGDSFVPTTTTAVYGPRVGNHIYNGSAWVNEGILHESEARTNLQTDNSVFTTSGNATVTTNAGTSPDGTNNAVLYNENSASNSNAGILGTVINASLPNADAAQGIYVKYVSGSGIIALITRGNDFSRQFFSYFNLQTGVKLSRGSGTGSMTSVDHNIENMGNGWYRISSISNDSSSNSRRSFVILAVADGVATRESNAKCLLYQSQTELGSTLSSLIPTNGATATRAAETLTAPAANLPYSSTNMSIQMDGKMTYADTNASFSTSASALNCAGLVTFYRWKAGNVDYFYAGVDGTTFRTGRPVFAQRSSVSGGFISTLGSGDQYSPDVNVAFNIASRHGPTFLNGANEGTLLTANTTPTVIPDLSATDFGIVTGFMGTIGQLRMWNEDLTDAGIVAASA